MAEVCAERGYAEVAVADVVKRAGVSTVTFYQQFADKRDCVLAAHRQLLGRLLEAVDPAGGARAIVHDTLALLAADPPSARLLTVEVHAVGQEGAKRHDAMVRAFAERLGADWILVAGMLALIGKLVVAGEAARLPELEAELVALL